MDYEIGRKKHRIVSSASDGNLPATFLRERIVQKDLEEKPESTLETKFVPNSSSGYSVVGFIGQVRNRLCTYLDYSQNNFHMNEVTLGGDSFQKHSELAEIDNDTFDFVEKLELCDFDVLMNQPTRHSFIPINLKAPTWCDKCGDFIWGIYKHCVVCENCQYTCHNKCQQAVTLECSMPKKMKDSDNTCKTGSPDKEKTIVQCGDLQTRKSVQKSFSSLTRNELRRKIEIFNKNSHGLLIEKPNIQKIFQGFIRVCINLIRPINMLISSRPVSSYDNSAVGCDKESTSKEMQMTSFYLPKNTTKVIHISCITTTREVICILLSKFCITDNPRKFALYEKNEKNQDCATTRKIGDNEKPLLISLGWIDEGIQNLDFNKFVLQENDTGDIMWDGFSIPELENFLSVLNLEEMEYINQVKQKYSLLKVQLQTILNDTKSSPT